MAMPKIGDSAPDFTLLSDSGGEISMRNCKGRRVILYFYPKDDTPGCTKQACEYRDLMGSFDKKNTVVLGVSQDDLESHRAFKRKYRLNFPLLCDPGYKVHRLYGAWGERKNGGKSVTGPLRTTVMIDEAGNVALLEREVSPEGDAKKRLDTV